jgi:myo-inositol 2-dehydrogenase / D-chiro-inositol 1-dehydrogenase
MEQDMTERSNVEGSQTRRQFLVSSSLLAGASLAGPLAINCSAYAAGGDGLRIGLVGCGGRGTGSLANALTVNKGARLTALADAFKDRALAARNTLKQKYGAQVAADDDHCFAGFDGCQKLLESGVDVVVLAQTPHFRPMHLEASVEAGVHIFAEKPMAVDAPGVRRVLAAGEKARQKKLSFVSGFQTRYSPGMREAVKRVLEGEIGDLVAIEGVYNTGPLWHRGRPPEWTEMEFQIRNWYYFTWLSGDHFVEQHVHFIDFVGWLMREEPPLHAWGYGGRSQRVEAKFGDIFDHHSVVYEYANGPRVYAMTRQQSGCFGGVYSTVFGTKGQFRRGGTAKQSGLYTNKGELKWQMPREDEAPEINRYREMFAAMEAGDPINDSFSMGRSTMLAILGRMATHSGQRITWDEAIASNKVLAPARYAWDVAPPVLPKADGSYPFPIPGVTQVL